VTELRNLTQRRRIFAASNRKRLPRQGHGGKGLIRGMVDDEIEPEFVISPPVCSAQ
jgi:hypothetical protein